MRTDFNAYDCTRGCRATATVRTESERSSGRKIPCRTCESNLRQQRTGPMLYQLNYIPSLLSSVIVWEN